MAGVVGVERPRRRVVDASGLSAFIVTPGDVITAEAGFMRGHGTFVEDGELIACVPGVVETVNKLIRVRPLVPLARKKNEGE